LLNNTRFHIDPYHPNIHKRSVEAKEDDIIITKSSETSFGPSEDFRRTRLIHSLVLPKLCYLKI